MKILFVINTWGGRRETRDKLMLGFRQLLDASGHAYEIAASVEVEDSLEIVCRAVREGFDTLWIGGGDGTVNVLLNQALNCPGGEALSLGIVPMGTINALAASLGIPQDPIAAARYLLAAKPRAIDAGRINGHAFLCFASLGFDARAVHEVTADSKERYGRFAYMASGLSGLRHLGTTAQGRFELTVTDVANAAESNSEELDARHVIISNIPNYAGLPLFRDAKPLSGAMELLAFHSNNPVPMLAWVAAGCMGWNEWHAKFPDTVSRRRVAAFRATFTEPFYLQLDGEAIAPTDDSGTLEFECLPGAVRVLLQDAQTTPAS